MLEIHLLFNTDSIYTPNKAIVLWGIIHGGKCQVLSPEKTVLMPDKVADCPMAHMAKVEDIASIRK